MTVANGLVYISLVDESGKLHKFGNRDVFKQQTISGKAESKSFTIGTETTIKLFDITESLLPDFDILAIEVDNDAMVELVTDDAGVSGEEPYTVGLKGGGLPLVIARSTSYGNYTVNFGGGTLENIETVRIRNLSDTLTVIGNALIAT